MSEGWKAYVDSLKQNAACIMKGAIVGQEDGSIWAKDDNFDLKDAELQTFANCWNDFTVLFQKGLFAEGTKYVVAQADAETGILAKAGKTGIMLGRSNKTVVIALYEGEAQDGQACRKAVDHILYYLKSVGY